MERGSEHRLNQMRSRGVSEGDGPTSIGSRHSTRSQSRDTSNAGHEHGNLADVISHYMHGIDSDNMTDMLASRYYGNMAHITESGTADRLPRPMNSTLPLFSPSVAHGHRMVRARSTNGSEGSLKRRPSYAVANAAAAAAANKYQQREAGGSVEAISGYVDREMAGIGLGQSATFPLSAAEHIEPLAGQNVVSHNPDKPENESLHGIDATQPSTAESQNASQRSANTDPGHDNITQPLFSKQESPLSVSDADADADADTQLTSAATAATTTAAESPLRRVSTAAYAAGESSEKEYGLGVQLESRPASQIRSRRSQYLGPTQYTPVAPSKKAALARGAPGLSYMFSPTIGTSRPSSVIGVSTPPQPPPARVQPTHLFESPEDAMPAHGDPKVDDGLQSFQDSAAAPTTNTQNVGNVGFADSERAKSFGAINIGALEQFLDEGEIPVSTSEEEFSDGIGWDEDYPGSSSRSSDQSTFSSTKDSRSARAAPTTYGSLPKQHPNIPRSRYASEGSCKRVFAARQSIASQDMVRVRASRGLSSSAADERAPLLEHTAITMPSVENPDMSDFAMPTQTNDSNRNEGFSGKKSSGRRKRHRKRHHEELFLDKDGFIDESYRFTFFNPVVGTIRAQEFADLRTPTMDLSALLQVGGCFWIDVLRPSFQEMHLMSKIFGIHALTVEDIMTQDMREKCETHATYYFVCFRSFDNDPNSEFYLEPKCIYNIVFREGIITFHMDPSVHQYHVLRRIRRQIDHIVVTPDWLNYAIIDDITDLLAPILQMIEFGVDSIDELVLVISSSEQSDMLLRISTARKRIMMVLRLLQGKADVVRALIKRFETATAMSTSQINAIGTASIVGPLSERQTVVWSDSSPQRRTLTNDNQAIPEGAAYELAMDQRKGQETILYLGDVLDHIVTMMQNAAHYDNILGRAHANYLAQISIELTESSNRTNDVVAKLSALAAIVVPLNFVTGMWGANVKVPGQDYDSLYYFFYILGFCMVYVVIAVAWARHYNIF
ncbi:CorA metal ion transporter [Coemansia sp. RSA 1721]|nr:CorA metal ion transporter [Coemansia sp. RSA 1721]